MSNKEKLMSFLSELILQRCLFQCPTLIIVIHERKFFISMFQLVRPILREVCHVAPVQREDHSIEDQNGNNGKHRLHDVSVQHVVFGHHQRQIGIVHRAAQIEEETPEHSDLVKINKTLDGILNTH